MISKINISGTDYPLRYGMSVLRAFHEVDLNALPPEEMLTNIIYQAHLCYAKSRQEPPTLQYFDIADHVEMALASNDNAKQLDIARIVTEWTESQVTSDLIKAGKPVVEEEKKSLSLIMSEVPTES